MSGVLPGNCTFSIHETGAHCHRMWCVGFSLARTRRSLYTGSGLPGGDAVTTTETEGHLSVSTRHSYARKRHNEKVPSHPVQGLGWSVVFHRSFAGWKISRGYLDEDKRFSSFLLACRRPFFLSPCDVIRTVACNELCPRGRV